MGEFSKQQQKKTSNGETMVALSQIYYHNSYLFSQLLLIKSPLCTEKSKHCSIQNTDSLPMIPEVDSSTLKIKIWGKS